MLQIVSIVTSLLCAASATQDTTQLPWFLSLGESSMQLRARVPVARQVVLVPDLATLCDEVGRWSPKAHWPVLIEDDVLAPMFIRRFAPQVVYRRASVGGKKPSGEAIIAAAAEAWGGSGSPRKAAMAAGLPAPSGLIVSSPTDPAAAAAVLLAAGRGQDIAWVTTSASGSGATLSLAQTNSLVQAVQAAATATGRSWSALGDDIDTLTICRKMAGRGTTSAATAGKGDAAAITDLLGRNEDGQRWAIAGWIFGTSARSAWIANCSLFLPRVDAWLCDTYPDAPPWSKWGLGPAGKLLESSTYQVTLLKHETLQQLQMANPRGLSTDIALMNSKGNADFFRMSGDQDGDPGDLPVLNTPTALSMIHSWSLRSPESGATVGGRWIDHGVYTYVGSTNEPQLQAFVPPQLFAKRIAGGIPFLVAARWWPDPNVAMSRPWQINTLGDPLMLAPSPKGSLRLLVPAMPAAVGAVQVQQAAVEFMKKTETAPSDEAFAAAISELVLIGKDEIAAKLWTAATQKDAGGPVSAAAVFGALFRQGDRNAMLMAWSRLARPSMLDGDMLWAAFGATLSEGTSDAALAALAQAISPGALLTRTERLMPIMSHRYGSGAAAGLLERAESMASSTREKRALAKLRSRITG
jgi:hypothetical protein